MSSLLIYLQPKLTNQNYSVSIRNFSCPTIGTNYQLKWCIIQSAETATNSWSDNMVNGKHVVIIKNAFFKNINSS